MKASTGNPTPRAHYATALCPAGNLFPRNNLAGAFAITVAIPLPQQVWRPFQIAQATPVNIMRIERFQGRQVVIGLHPGRHRILLDFVSEVSQGRFWPQKFNKPLCRCPVFGHFQNADAGYQSQRAGVAVANVVIARPVPLLEPLRSPPGKSTAPPQSRRKIKVVTDDEQRSQRRRRHSRRRRWANLQAR